MFKDWFKRADTHIMHLERWQTAQYEKQLKKAYAAGRKQGREEVLILAENAAVLREMMRTVPNAQGKRRAATGLKGSEEDGATASV